MARCILFEPIEKGCNENCINCKRWDGKKCKDEAELLAQEQKRYGPTDRAMRQNRGVWLE